MSNQTTPQSYVLPDLQSICPWKSSLNPHLSDVAPAASAWILSYDVLGSLQSQQKRDYFLKRGGELLCGYAYPYAGAEQLRTACDFINLLFVIDEVSDEQNGLGAMKTGQSVINALREESYDDGSLVCQITKDFKKRLISFEGTDTLNRFVEHVASYVRAVGIEAKYREDGVVLDFTSFNVLRRENSAARCCFGLIGYMLGLDLPDVVFEHPAYQKMHFAGVDMVTWANDVYSYDMEQAMGHLTNNILVVLQREHGVSLQDAADLVGVHWQKLSETFEAAKTELPSFGAEVDKVVAEHIKAMEVWVAGNLDWSFGTPRYFSDERDRVKETLTDRGGFSGRRGNQIN